MEFQVYDYIIQNARKAEDQQNFSRVKGEHFKGITNQQICIFKVFKGCLCYYIRQHMLVLFVAFNSFLPDATKELGSEK